LCSGDGLCVLFISDSVAAFGNAGDVKRMYNLRHGQSASLAAKTPVARLLATADLSAPIIGVAPGSELTSWTGNALTKQLSSQLDGIPALGTVSLFEYSVTLGSKARVNMYFDCSSSLAASTLSLSLRSLNALSTWEAGLANSGATLPFRDVTVGANENRVHLTLETAIQ
jgi:hypothetical protein